MDTKFTDKNTQSWERHRSHHQSRLIYTSLSWENSTKADLFKVKWFVKPQRKIRPNCTCSSNSAKQKDPQVDVITVRKTGSRAQHLES